MFSQNVDLINRQIFSNWPGKKCLFECGLWGGLIATWAMPIWTEIFFILGLSGHQLNGRNMEQGGTFSSRLMPLETRNHPFWPMLTNSKKAMETSSGSPTLSRKQKNPVFGNWWHDGRQYKDRDLLQVPPLVFHGNGSSLPQLQLQPWPGFTNAIKKRHQRCRKHCWFCGFLYFADFCRSTVMP